MPSEEQSVLVPAPQPEITQLVPPTPKAHVVQGGPGTGKTEALVHRARALVDEGTDPAAILVLCATPSAAREFARRLANAGVEGVRCACPREVELEIMGTQEAMAHSGRDARLLAPFEFDFLMEDLKTSGLRAKRLREMLKFFFRCLTELADDDPQWLVTIEEQSVFELLRTCLAFERAIIEPELANLCVRFLRDNPMAKAKAGYEHVLADDYQMISRASQMVANMLAKQGICVAADPDACLEVFESYPYAQGVDELLQANPGAEVELLKASRTPDAVLAGVNLLRADMEVPVEGLAASGIGDASALEVLSSDDPSAEMKALGDRVASTLEGGTAAAPEGGTAAALEGGTAAAPEGAAPDPSQVYVAALRRPWERNVGKALASRGIQTSRVPNPRMVSGDIRDNDRCEAARVLTALLLAADPHDGVAWRSWCGFGDYLTHSSALMTLREIGSTRALAMDAALEAIAVDPAAYDMGGQFGSVEPLAEAYNRGLAMLEQARGLEGEPLLQFLARSVAGEGAEVPAALRALTAPFDDGELAGQSAQDMAKRALTRLALPRFEGAGVRLGTLQQLAGLRPHTMVVAGFVNGFLPCREYFDRAQMPIDKAERQHDRDVRLVRCMMGKPDGHLVLSFFDHTDLETAEMLNMKIERIRMVDGVRQARVSPSDFAATMMKTMKA